MTVLRVILVLLVGAGVCSAQQPLRVLFVGNSYTKNNKLPSVLQRMVAAQSRLRPLEIGQTTPGGATLERHWKAGKVVQLLEAKQWDYVVLQGQSQRPSFPARQRVAEVDKYARLLCAKIRAAKARPLLFMTWGYREGDRRNVKGDSYAGMQERLRRGYTAMAAACQAKVVPVGSAWKKALSKRKGLDLWGRDGSHPNKQGTYLAACVFFKALYRKSPVGNAYTMGLDQATARFLQEVAASTVR